MSTLFSTGTLACCGEVEPAVEGLVLSEWYSYNRLWFLGQCQQRNLNSLTQKRVVPDCHSCFTGASPQTSVRQILAAPRSGSRLTPSASTAVVVVTVSMVTSCAPALATAPGVAWRHLVFVSGWRHFFSILQLWHRNFMNIHIHNIHVYPFYRILMALGRCSGLFSKGGSWAHHSHFAFWEFRCMLVSVSTILWLTHRDCRIC
jgi:hypothetical protein